MHLPPPPSHPKGEGITISGENSSIHQKTDLTAHYVPHICMMKKGRGMYHAPKKYNRTANVCVEPVKMCN
jgi:hypothetical protein